MRWSITQDAETGEKYIAVNARGGALLLNHYTNKGTAFTAQERATLALDGLIPPAEFTIEQQLDRVCENYKSARTDLDRFVYLTALQDRNETLFFRLVLDHIEEMMPVVYTPAVGEACQKFSHIYRRGRGLYITYEQRDRIEEILRNHPRTPSVIVVTDGERILGLGDQGAGGMAIPIGKLCLYTLCAGIPPHRTLPILLDVGTDNEERLHDPLYVGTRHRRIRGGAYQNFVDRFVSAVQRVYPGALLQWEDFHKGNALTQLNRFRDELCTFNDDIQGTAAVVVAGIVTALRLSGQRIKDQRIVFAGAGASAQGIADLLVSALVESGLTGEEARRRIWTVDSRGLVTEDRVGLEAFKAAYARPREEVAAYGCSDPVHISLEEVVGNARPTILIGVSGSPGTFTEGVVRAMARVNERPVVFPLSNPTSRAECTAEQAINWSEGRAIVATGSPSDPVQYGGSAYRIGQGNNAFIFPGVGLGVSVGRIRRVTDGMFLDAAEALAEQVTQRDLDEGAVYPPVRRIRDCSLAVACAVIRRAVAEDNAPEQDVDGLEARLGRAMWYPEYLPVRYDPVASREDQLHDVVRREMEGRLETVSA